jgi:hypothetical protein
MDENRDLEVRQMAYRDQLYPWCIIRSLANLDSLDYSIVARFRRHSDAEAQLKLLQQRMPQVAFRILFNKQQELADSNLLEPDAIAALSSSSQAVAVDGNLT